MPNENEGLEIFLASILLVFFFLSILYYVREARKNRRLKNTLKFQLVTIENGNKDGEVNVIMDIINTSKTDTIISFLGSFNVGNELGLLLFVHNFMELARIIGPTGSIRHTFLNVKLSKALIDTDAMMENLTDGRIKTVESRMFRQLTENRGLEIYS